MWHGGSESPSDPDDLEQHLTEQIEFLKSSCDAFDAGKKAEAKRLATTIRLLVHDTEKSHSLLKQLGRKGGRFLDMTAIPKGRSAIGVVGNIGISVRGFIAPLDDWPHPTKWVSFENWWHGVVFIDASGEKLTRKDLVLTMANQHGGAHVGLWLNALYARLVKGNSLRILWRKGMLSHHGGDPHLAAVRQIAHELLKTLEPGYEKKLQRPPTPFITNFVLTVEPVVLMDAGFPRRALCPCGSGRQYRLCHGRR